MIEAFDQNQEVTEWRKHKLEAYNGRLSLHTLIESYTYGKEWQGVIHDFDLFFFTRDANDPAVKDFAYHPSSMKIIMRGKHNRVHIGGLRRAENLKKDIADYLKIPQKVDANSNHQAMTEKPAFEPSSPKNKVPVCRETLEDYEGLYQLVKRNTTEVIPGEEDLIIIRIENDHLVIPYILKTTYSIYSIENNKFKRALSFLFSDSGSGGILTFNRNKDNQVNGFILEIEEGIYKYLKLE